MAPIGTLVVSQPRHAALNSLPLLLSADTSGVLACWPALVVNGDVASGSKDVGNESGMTSSHKPLWYVVQASRSLPHCEFVAEGRLVACAGTEGIKASLYYKIARTSYHCHAFVHLFTSYFLPACF